MGLSLTAFITKDMFNSLILRVSSINGSICKHTIYLKENKNYHKVAFLPVRDIYNPNNASKLLEQREKSPTASHSITVATALVLYWHTTLLFYMFSQHLANKSESYQG